MAQTETGSHRTAKTNKEKYDAIYLKKYGVTYYQYIGAKGGKKGRTGGFASKKVGVDGLTGIERARISGSVGGKISKRQKNES